jgi:hypothetical protein
MARQRDDSERQRWTREDALRVHDRAKDFEDKTNEATIAAGQVALRTAVLINGGAAIAVLAFIGGVVDPVGVPKAGKMAGTLIFSRSVSLLAALPWGSRISPITAMWRTRSR